MDIASQLTADIARSIGRELSEDSRIEIAEWQRGRNLASIPPHARGELFAMLEEYVIRFTDSCVSLPPDSPQHEVLGKQALAHAAAKMFAWFEGDFNRLVDMKAPGVVKNYVGQIPGESL